MSVIARSVVKTDPAPWKCEVTSGKHHFITDKPESFGGHDTGPAPYDFLTASLAACTMITLRMYSQHKGLDFGKIQVEAHFFANKEGQEWVERQVIIEQPLDAELQQKVLNICQKTPVTKTLLRSMEIRTEFG